MRKVILQMHVSLDGFVETKTGDLGWIFPSFDDEYTEWAVASLWEAGVHVMGGVTGRLLGGYWPSPTEDRDKPFAPAMNKIPKVVFSKSLDHLDWNDTRIVKGEPRAEMERLKQDSGGHILVHGGPSLVYSLTDQWLIDEYRLLIQPVVLGSGKPLFRELSEPLRLELLDMRRFQSGAILHVYGRGHYGHA
jgi:dihydrofolate reductase